MPTINFSYRRFTCSSVVATLFVSNSFAAVVSFNFTAIVAGTDTSWDGSQISGSVSYDDELTPTVGPPIALTAAQLEAVSIDAFGQTFTAQDEAEFDTLTAFTFIPVVPENLRSFIFLVSEDPAVSNPVSINAPEISSFEIEISPSPASLDNYIATATVTSVTSVPEPSSALLAGCALLFGLRRRR